MPTMSSNSKRIIYGIDDSLMNLGLKIDQPDNDFFYMRITAYWNRNRGDINVY